MDPLAENPFFILELPPTATPMEIERQGKKLLAKLDLGLAAAAMYPSPLGARPRSADDVRRAMQALSDPRRRLAAEPFATTPCLDSGPSGSAGVTAVAGEVVDEVMRDASPILWWRPC
jgi:hypothetical protein